MERDRFNHQRGLITERHNTGRNSPQNRLDTVKYK